MPRGNNRPRSNSGDASLASVDIFGGGASVTTASTTAPIPAPPPPLPPPGAGGADAAAGGGGAGAGTVGLGVAHSALSGGGGGGASVASRGSVLSRGPYPTEFRYDPSVVGGTEESYVERVEDTLPDQIRRMSSSFSSLFGGGGEGRRRSSRAASVGGGSRSGMVPGAAARVGPGPAGPTARTLHSSVLGGTGAPHPPGGEGPWGSVGPDQWATMTGGGDHRQFMELDEEERSHSTKSKSSDGEGGLDAAGRRNSMVGTSRFDMDAAGGGFFDDSHAHMFDGAAEELKRRGKGVTSSEMRKGCMGRYPFVDDGGSVGSGSKMDRGSGSILKPAIACLVCVGASIGAAVVLAGGGESGNAIVDSASSGISSMLDAVGIKSASDGSGTGTGGTVGVVMPYPRAQPGSPDRRPYAMAFPHDLSDVVESTSPRFGDEEVAFVFDPEGGDSSNDGDAGVSLVGTVLGRCHGLTGAAELGKKRGEEWKGKPLEVVTIDGLDYANVDTSRPSGIDRAALLNVASSDTGVDYISISQHAHYASQALLSNDRRGRMVALVRHPVDRAVARFYGRKETGDPALKGMTLEQYASSSSEEGATEDDNQLTRYLSGKSDVAGSASPTGPLTRAHVDLAMEVLRRKALVLLLGDDAKESFERIDRYLGLDGATGDHADCHTTVLSEAAAREAELADKFGGEGNGLPEKDGPVYARLAERNKLDMELYEYARELFAAQADLPTQEAEAVNDEEPLAPDRNCVENGKFAADPPSNNWYAVQSDLRVVRGLNGKGNALRAENRGHQIFGGMWQNLQTGGKNRCLHTGEWYEVRATVRATTQGADGKEVPFECDPTIMYNNVDKSCPAVGVRIGERKTEVALTVGPVRPNQEWTELYGVMQATSEMLSSTVSLFVSRAPPDVDLSVDSVSVAPAAENAVGATDCVRPIANGDAEVGDHRFWFVRGAAGGGRIEMVTPGYGGSKYAFRHSGSREKRYRGMLQRLDASCFTEGTSYSISAKFRYFSIDEKNGQIAPAPCRKDNPKAENSCPVFDMDFVSPNGVKVNTGPLQNEAPGDVKLGEWNEIRHTVTVNADMALRPQVLLYVNSVDPNYNYDLDDVSMEIA